jgi:hypothetical protein
MFQFLIINYKNLSKIHYKHAYIVRPNEVNNARRLIGKTASNAGQLWDWANQLELRRPFNGQQLHWCFQFIA